MKNEKKNVFFLVNKELAGPWGRGFVPRSSTFPPKKILKTTEQLKNVLKNLLKNIRKDELKNALKRCNLKCSEKMDLRLTIKK